MKIAAINSAIPARSFKGILFDEGTKSENNIHYSHGLEEDVGTSRSTTIKSLYPFKNESKEEIAKVVETHSKYNSWQNGCANYIEETIVKVKKALPFTEVEYKEFIKNNNITKEEFVKFIKMFDFMTKVK